jgi:hypothetical protein
MHFPQPTQSRCFRARCFARARQWLAGLFVGGILSSTSLLAEESSSLEYQVKGAFLVKFGMFVDWAAVSQESKDSGTFIIGILGSDPFGAAFDDAVKKTTVNGRRVVVKRGTTADELNQCQLVFVSALEMSRMADALTQLSANGVLTVGDAPGFASNGGMIGFIKEDGKLRFEFNTSVAEKSGLKISSKLLQVGKVVTDTKTSHG